MFYNNSIDIFYKNRIICINKLKYNKKILAMKDLFMSYEAILIVIVAFITCAFLLSRHISKKREERELNATYGGARVAKQNEEDGDDEDDEEGRFDLFNGEEIGWSAEFSLCIDNSTGVQYLIIYEIGMTLLLDENGKPIIYNGEFDGEDSVKEADRFIIISDEDLPNEWSDIADAFNSVCVDTKTRVSYLIDGPGITPFVNENGIPILYPEWDSIRNLFENRRLA